LNYNWQEKKLGDLLSILTDYHANGSYKKLKENVTLLDKPEYAVMIRTKNFEQNDFLSDLKYINKHAYDFLKKSKVYPGDILMNKIANAGSVYFMPELKRPVSLAMNLFLLRVDQEYANQRYIYYYLKANEKYVKSFAIGVATNTITKENVRNLVINLPKKSNQRKIVAILSAYDNLIENNTRRIQILEEMAQRIYKEWFVDFKYPGHENDQMIDSDLGMIPEGWEAGKLDMIARLVKNKYDDQLHSNFPLLDLSRIPRKSNSISDFGESNEITTARIIFKKSNILFGAIRPYFHKVVYCPNDGITNSSVFVIENRDGFSNMYLFSNLFSKSTVKWASQHSGGTKMPVIGWSVFKNMPVIIPRTEILIKFDQILNPMLQKISNFVHKNQNLKKTRSLLLPKLISGKRDVSDLDIDTSILND
jgi:type I restriction enzyme, S subunit